MKRILFYVFLSVGLNSCFLFGKSGGDDPDPEPIDETTQFIATPQIFDTPLDKTNEASGIAPSRNYPGSLFIVDDSEAAAGYHVFSKDGSYQKFVALNATNRDWEDVATGVGPEAGKNYIYAADIGDNGNIYKQYTIYRFEEPASTVNRVDNFETIQFHYPNNESNNAETLMLDPKTKDLYVITKDQFNVKVFRLKYPQPVNQPFEAEFLGTIPYWGIVAGDISANGDEILLKTYIAVFYWKLKTNETIIQAISRTRDVGAPYIQENQGESICWDYQAKGYYTISERGGLPTAPKLYYYSKK